MDKEPRVKAAGVNYAMSFISSELGEAGLRSILASFDSRDISSRRLLPSEWVSEKTYHDLFVATGRYLESNPARKPAKDFFFEMGRTEAIDGINKYYKSLIRMFDTKFMLTRSPLLWGMSHSNGSLQVESAGKTSAYVYVSDYPVPCKEFCYNLAGYMWAVGELTKAKMIRVVELECVTEGAKRCKFIGEWK